MKKIILLFSALFIGGGFALAQASFESEPAAPCNSANCPGSGVLCCKDADNNSYFYKAR